MTNSTMQANEDYLESTGRACTNSLLYPGNSMQDANRCTQPASLVTITTCTTIQRQNMRQPHCQARLFLGRKKSKSTKLMAILAPLVVYSLFQVTANLLTHNNANIYDESASSHASPRCNPFAKSAGIKRLQSHCGGQSLDDKVLEHEALAWANNRASDVRHFNAPQSRVLCNNAETSNQVEPSCRTLTSSCAQRISATSRYAKEEEDEEEGSLLSGLAYKLAYFLEAISNEPNKLSWPNLGPRVLMAEAVSVPSNNLLSQHNSKEIIVLNSTNFNSELIQHEHPFAHIKLVEYYLSYCGVCLKFKPTFAELAREIFPWRNVIRVSAIDLGISNNSPIAHSWSVDVVPTLRLHPPPSEPVASKLAKHLSTLISKSNPFELQRSMYQEYSGAKLMISSLDVIKYTNDGRRTDSSTLDKVDLLKSDLIRYIERYVKENDKILPVTWPNLRPVKEVSLLELRDHHPRQELFLIVEDDSRNSKHSSGLEILLSLSSSASWRAARYVRVSENRQIIEDVIRYIKKEDAERLQDNLANRNSEQIELLENLVNSKYSQETIDDNVLLVHVDFSHISSGKTSLSRPPLISVVTSSSLRAIEQSAQYDQQQSGLTRRARHSIINQAMTRVDSELRSVTRRSLFGSDAQDGGAGDLKRKIDLMTLYINQTYSEIDEDREFVNAIKKLDAEPTSSDLKARVASVSKMLKQAEHQISETEVKSTDGSRSEGEAISKSTKLIGSLINRASETLISLTTSAPPKPLGASSNAVNSINELDYEYDYEDKLKAIRYILFNEIPRKPMFDKNLTEKQEYLSTILNLVTVIKAYFPLTDAPSVQFISGAQNYLLRQQQYLANLIASSSSSSASTSGGLDLNAFKQELKRLESEGKRLPEVKEYKHCKFGGYPCAVWRLFHTLTAFEYVKLSQINQYTPAQSQQQQQLARQPPAQQVTSDGNQQLAANQSNDQSLPTAASLSSHEQEQLNSPVERVISPPSTTTSLSLTIATANSESGINSSISKRQHELDLLPTPVLLVMRDYVTHFFSCEECSRKFKLEAADLNFERIRQQEPAEFSVMWLWETHNRVSKRLSVNPETNPPEHPKKWFPTYRQCSKCYNKPPSYLSEDNLELPAIFHEAVDWNRQEILAYLLCQYTRSPMDNLTNIFGYQVPYGVVIIITCSLLIIILLRCTSCYIERQRRHKASLLNSNGYSMELQRSC